jgi:hypothetical protein
MIPPKVHDSSITKSNNIKIGKMQDKYFKSLVLEMINDLKEDSNEYMSEEKKLIQDLDEKLSNLELKFREREREILKKSGNLGSENLIKENNSVENITHRLD